MLGRGGLRVVHECRNLGMSRMCASAGCSLYRELVGFARRRITRDFMDIVLLASKSRG